MFATVDLPEPDSPTMASAVPRLTEKDTSSTALNISFLAGQLEFLGQAVMVTGHVLALFDVLSPAMW